jgi:DNA invertase Pin-like site-specific DNA recombinase
MRFAFYGRVSTEDMQDPMSSKQWQVARAKALIEPNGGTIVAEYFDVGTSRSLPWKRRPESLALLDAMKRPDRGFEAVVVGEPSRAFHGAQFQNTFPLFVARGVQLWVPDVGGYVDPESDGAEMMMAIYGTMSAQERRRIKIRVRGAMTEQAKIEGRFLGGRPPYGYRLGDAGAHPNPSKAAVGQRMHQLEVDPTAAPIVERIFREYVAGAGIGSIAEGLNRDRIPSTSGHDPARNRHRAGANGAWGKSAVRAIIGNPKYTGRQVWNRQRRTEQLIGEEDVALGHQSKMRWNDRSDWIWSAEETHEAIISPEVFAAATAQRAVAGHRQAVVKPRRRHTYALSSLVRCGVCDRRMSGSWNHGQAHYRCGWSAEYAGATGKHPEWVYLKEADVTGPLDDWLLRHFDPENIDAAVEAMAAARSTDDAGAARAEAARRTIVECDKRMAGYKSALDEGVDPALVAGWIKECEGQRLAAERELSETVCRVQLGREEIRSLVALVRPKLDGLSGADPETRKAIYQGMGLRLTFHPERNAVGITACTQVRVGGGT